MSWRGWELLSILLIAELRKSHLPFEGLQLFVSYSLALRDRP